MANCAQLASNEKQDMTRGKKYCFQVSHKKNLQQRIFLLHAKDREQMKQWMQCLNAAIRPAEETPPTVGAKVVARRSVGTAPNPTTTGAILDSPLSSSSSTDALPVLIPTPSSPDQTEPLEE